MKSKLKKKLIPSLNLHIIVKSFRIDTFLASTRKFNLEPAVMPDLVYKFECPCKEANYIGETSLRLSARVTTHITQQPTSSVREHADHCETFQSLYQDHLASSNKTNVPRNLATFIGRYFERLKSTRGYPQRRFLEACFIKKIKPTLNVQMDSQLLEIEI